MSTEVATGIDGCRGGWVVARQDAASLTLEVVPRFVDAIAGSGMVAVDMPIGLLDERQAGGRRADREARRILGRPRSSSVFSPPLRRHLGARSYDDVRRDGVTIQAYHLLGKLAEVDAAVDPTLQERVFEAHPEMAFMRMNGGVAIAAPKRTAAGRSVRAELLARALGDAVPPLIDDFLGRTRRSVAQPDDALDALALVVTARRRARGEALRLPEGPPERDATGLEIAIWY